MEHKSSRVQKNPQMKIIQGNPGTMLTTKETHVGHKRKTKQQK